MTIKVINAGNCMLCGREIKIVVRRGNSKFPNIFFCPECERRIKKGKLDKKVWGMNDYEPSDFIAAIDEADTIIPADKEK